MCCCVDGGWQGYGHADGPDADQYQHHHQFSCPWGEGVHDSSSTVQRDGHHGEHAGGDRGEGDELVDRAVDRPEIPDSADDRG